MSGRQGPQASVDMAPVVDVALLFAVDSSGSISNERLILQIEGYAAAVASPAFVAAVASLPLGRVALGYIAWSNHDRQQFLVPWQVVDGPRSAALWAHTLRTATHPGVGYTSISGAIDFCVGQLLAAPRAGRRLIDLSADGRNNDGRAVTAARDAAVAAGITINGLPMLDVEPDLDGYFHAEVVGGPDAFVMVAHDAATLAAAIRRKLLTEIAGVAGPRPRLV